MYNTTHPRKAHYFAYQLSKAKYHISHLSMSSSINRPTEENTSPGNVLDLNAQLLNFVDNWCHHMASVAIQNQEWDDVLGCHCDNRRRHLLNLRKHHLLVHPCGILTAIMVGCLVCWELTSCDALVVLSLKMMVNGRRVLSPAIVTAPVAHLMSFEDVQMWTVVTPITSNVFF